MSVVFSNYFAIEITEFVKKPPINNVAMKYCPTNIPSPFVIFQHVLQ